MKKLFKKIVHHPLISGSVIVILGNNIANVFNFLFNLFMSRNLSVPDYGILASLISLITLATIPASSFTPTIIRYAAFYFAKNELDLVRDFFLEFKKIFVLFGIGMIFIFSLFSGQIGTFFNISQPLLIILASFVVFVSYLTVINAGLLQAKLAFVFASFLYFVGSFLKFVLGYGFISLGLSVSGAMWAYIISYGFSYLLSYKELQFLFKRKKNNLKIDLKDITSYAIISVITMFFVASFINTDVLLVKHFFSSKEAGIYAGLSLIARVIYFISAPIATVMFPYIVQKHTTGENYHKALYISVLLVTLPSLVLVILYNYFPELIIVLFLKNKEYLHAASLLGLFGLYTSLYSILVVLVNFFLSIKKTAICFPVVLGGCMQIILVWFFHSSFLEVIRISLSIVSATLALLLLYYIKLYVAKK